MKKFLFTLAALMMAGSALAADYLYCDPIKVTEDQVGTDVLVPVKAHFDNYVSAVQCDLTIPTGIQLRKIAKGADATITFLDMWGEETNTAETEGTIFTQRVQTKNFAIAQTDGGYWDANGDGEITEDETYGSVKWAPGEYDEMVVLTIRVTANYTAGDIVVRTQPSCGDDTRPDVVTCPKGQDNFHSATITVEGSTPVIEDLTGEIVVGNPTEDGLVAISYNGTEDVTIVVTLNGEVVELVDGMLQLAEGENTVVVTVSAQGYNDMVGTYNITWTAPVVPEVTEAPTINWNPETFTVEAVGNGEVLMYVDGELVANPYTFDQTDVEMTYTVTATAQEPGKEISDVATLTVTVPAKEVTPVDPDDHTVGYWLVMLDKNNNPKWYKLAIGDNGDYTTTVALTYDIFGRYNHDTGYRGNVPFYFVVNNVRYGAEDAEVETNLGQALMNPLFNTEGYYTVPVGYNYTLGIAFETEGDAMFVYAAQAGFTGVDELMNGKAVAGVRYFNMAGQEMTEANGVTIVVTTYTDGTTSAVKVMK